MRRLIVVTQQVDPEHPALAATVPKLRALAARVDELVVFADEAVPGALPENCRFVSYRAPTRFRRGLRFETALARELARGRPVAVLAHMCPIYAVLAAPLARPLGVPVLLWFTQWRRTRLLALAERASTRVLTVDARLLQLRKARSIGHGIDLAQFPCVDPPANEPLRLLALGRTSRSKELPLIAEAVRRLPGVELEVRGPALTPDEERHRAELAGAGVSVGDAVARADVPALFARVDALVNATRAGGLDKVVYEACAACVPAIAPASGFGELLGDLAFADGDADSLAHAVRRLAALTPAERAARGHELRERVARAHSVESWADAVVAEGR